MTHDERIEAMARALCDSDYYGAWDECSEEWRCNLRAMATAALAAAGVDRLEAALAEAQRDAENDLSKALARMAMVEGETAALRAQVNAFYLGTPESRLLAMTKERDALREALEKIASDRYNIRDFCDIARAALREVK
jgi:hypothetical protein